MARVYEFGPFALNVDARTLSSEGTAIDVPDKVFELLAVLAEAAGETVSKEQLVEAVWGGAPIGDSNISQHLLLARRALGDLTKPYRVIETMHARGYRIVLPVRVRIDSDRAQARQAFRRTMATQYVRGARHFATLGTGPAMESSDELCRAALDVDREHSAALAQLALNAAIGAACGYSEAPRAWQACRQYTSRALMLDRNCPHAQLAAVYAALFEERSFLKALDGASKLAHANGVSKYAHVARMLAHLGDGHVRGAIQAADEAANAFPESILVETYAAWIAYHTGGTRDTIFRLQRLLASRPEAAFARVLLGRTFLALRDYARARVQFETIVFPRPSFAPRFEKFRGEAIAGLAYVSAREGDRYGAAALRDDLARRHAGDYYGAALVANALGDQSGADAILQRATQERDPRTLFAHIDPLLAVAVPP